MTASIFSTNDSVTEMLRPVGVNSRASSFNSVDFGLNPFQSLDEFLALTKSSSPTGGDEAATTISTTNLPSPVRSESAELRSEDFKSAMHSIFNGGPLPLALRSRKRSISATRRLSVDKLEDLKALTNSRQWNNLEGDHLPVDYAEVFEYKHEAEPALSTEPALAPTPPP